MVRSAAEFIIGPRFARTRWRVSNHGAQSLILRDAAKWPLLRMRSVLYAATGLGTGTAGFGGREMASVSVAATMHSAPAAKNAGR